MSEEKNELSKQEKFRKLQKESTEYEAKDYSAPDNEWAQRNTIDTIHSEQIGNDR